MLPQALSLTLSNDEADCAALEKSTETRYIACRREPAVRDLDREELIAELQRLRPEFEGRGVTHMTLFGSRARRDNRPDSDVDLVIDISDAVDDKFSLLELIGVGHVIEDRFGLGADVLTRRSLSDSFKSAVGKDQVPVF